MTWLFFVFFFLHQDGMPWWAWVVFAGCVLWDRREERAAKLLEQERSVEAMRALVNINGELQTLNTRARR